MSIVSANSLPKWSAPCRADCHQDCTKLLRKSESCLAYWSPSRCWTSAPTWINFLSRSFVRLSQCLTSPALDSDDLSDFCESFVITGCQLLVESLSKLLVTWLHLGTVLLNYCVVFEARAVCIRLIDSSVKFMSHRCAALFSYGQLLLGCSDFVSKQFTFLTV